MLRSIWDLTSQQLSSALAHVKPYENSSQVWTILRRHFCLPVPGNHVQFLKLGFFLSCLWTPLLGSACPCPVVSYGSQPVCSWRTRADGTSGALSTRCLCYAGYISWLLPLHSMSSSLQLLVWIELCAQKGCVQVLTPGPVSVTYLERESLQMQSN